MHMFCKTCEENVGFASRVHFLRARQIERPEEMVKVPTGDLFRRANSGAAFLVVLAAAPSVTVLAFPSSDVIHGQKKHHEVGGDGARLAH
jgi:hypothetical protein